MQLHTSDKIAAVRTTNSTASNVCYSQPLRCNIVSNQRVNALFVSLKFVEVVTGSF